MTLLLWCVCGGFLLHILECNYLSVLVKPNYERFIDTSLDIIDMNLTIIWPPGREAIVDMLRNSPSSLSRELADRSYVTEVISCRGFILKVKYLLSWKSYEEYDEMATAFVFGSRSAVAAGIA